MKVLDLLLKFTLKNIVQVFGAATRDDDMRLGHNMICLLDFL